MANKGKGGLADSLARLHSSRKRQVVLVGKRSCALALAILLCFQMLSIGLVPSADAAAEPYATGESGGRSEGQPPSSDSETAGGETESNTSANGLGDAVPGIDGSSDGEDLASGIDQSTSVSDEGNHDVLAGEGRDWSGLLDNLKLDASIELLTRIDGGGCI